MLARRHPLAALLGVAALVAACGESLRGGSVPPPATTSRVDVYLSAEGTQQTAGDVVLVLSGARVVDDEGGEHALALTRRQVRSSEGKRAHLAGAEMDPGGYRTLVLAVSAAHVDVEGGRVPLRLLPPAGGAEAPGIEGIEIEIPIAARVRARQAVTVFLDWHVDASLVDAGTLRPVLSTTVERPRATVGLMYVTDAGTGSALAVDRSSREIVGTAKVGADPSGLAISDDRRLLFVSNSRDGSLSIVDLRDNFAVSTIPIRISAHAEDVVVLDSFGSRSVATANRRLDTVSIFDVSRSLRVADVPVAREPIRLAAAPRLRRLFVLSSRAEELAAIDVNSRGVVGRLPLESGPTDVSIDRREELLFVSHEVSRNLLVVSTRQLAVVESIFIGGGATAVLAGRRRDRVFVATASPPELLVIELRVSAIVKRIPISGVVRSLDQPLDGPFVYGACPDEGTVVVVNVISGREDAPITDIARPTDVVVVD